MIKSYNFYLIKRTSCSDECLMKFGFNFDGGFFDFDVFFFNFSQLFTGFFGVGLASNNSNNFRIGVLFR